MSPEQPTRGRPRNTAASAAILEAALDLLAEVGFAALSFEAVARQAKVSKPTIYRRFPTKGALVAAALSEALAEANPVVPDTGDIAADIKTVLGNTSKALADTVFGGAMIEVIAPAARDDDLSEMLSVFLGQRREVMRTLLDRADAADRLRADVETAIDLLLGAIYFRHLITHRPLTRAFVDEAVDAVLVAA